MASQSVEFPAADDNDEIQEHVDRDPDTLPTSTDPSGTCPRCGRVAQFTSVQTLVLKRQISFAANRAVERAVVLECQGCQECTVVIELYRSGSAQGLHWWPMPGFDAPDVAGVPDDVANAYNEGSRCISVNAPNAAVAMFRTAIAHIVQEKGSDTAKAERDLYHRIDRMAKEGALFSGFGEWAHHVRNTGNAGAHGEKFEPISVHQASELQRFVSQLINFLYVQPAQLAAAMGPTKRSPA